MTPAAENIANKINWMEAVFVFLLIPFTVAGQPFEQITLEIAGSSFEFAHIPRGSFEMGSLPDEEGRNPDREKLHHVTITEPFWMGTTEITQEQWEAVMGSNPSKHVGKDLPVENISWTDIQVFIDKLHTATGKTFRLPSEAQWEYACRAGTKTPLSGDMDLVSWNIENSGRKSHPVATKEPNPWGLYDMHGNILEFCSDWFTEDISELTEDPKGPSSGIKRVMKGGGFTGRTRHLRAADRQPVDPNIGDFYMGFRLTMDM